MRTQLILIFIIFAKTLAIGQSPKELIKSARLIKDAFAGPKIDILCMPEPKYDLKEGEEIFIIGTTTCTKTSNKKTINFLKYLRNSDTFNVETTKIENGENIFNEVSTYNLQQIEELVEFAEQEAQKTKERVAQIKEKLSKAGVIIRNYGLVDEGESIEATSFYITIYNPTKKVIKYISFNFTGINAVGDPVTDKLRGKNITLRGIGPVKPDEEATYNYKYAWLTDIVESVKVNYVLVEYMDGSKRKITDFNSMTLEGQIKNIIK